MVLMYDSNPVRPRFKIACGVLACGNSLRVALFTPTSVACALSNTAASSSNTLVYSSSVTGIGLAARRVAKKSSIWGACMNLGTVCEAAIVGHGGVPMVFSSVGKLFFQPPLPLKCALIWSSVSGAALFAELRLPIVESKFSCSAVSSIKSACSACKVCLVWSIQPKAACL